MDASSTNIHVFWAATEIIGGQNAVTDLWLIIAEVWRKGVSKGAARVSDHIKQVRGATRALRPCLPTNGERRESVCWWCAGGEE